MPENDELIAMAKRAREAAYAPYSGYRVGAAVRDERGRVWSGCNVENASYGLSICAERAAVFAMVSGGGTQVREVAVITEDLGTPCGACLQVIAEFCEDGAEVPVRCSGVEDRAPEKRYTMAELLPRAFRLSEDRRTGKESKAV